RGAPAVVARQPSVLVVMEASVGVPVPYRDWPGGPVPNRIRMVLPPRIFETPAFAPAVVSAIEDRVLCVAGPIPDADLEVQAEVLVSGGKPHVVGRVEDQARRRRPGRRGGRGGGREGGSERDGGQSENGEPPGPGRQSRSISHIHRTSREDFIPDSRGRAAGRARGGP